MDKAFLCTGSSRSELNWDERNPSSYLSKDDALKKLQKAVKRAEKKRAEKPKKRSFSAKKKVFPVIVDYSKSLAEMIRAGNYDWVNSNITVKHFPIQGQGQVELDIELVHYDRAMSSEDVIHDLDQRGLRPATLLELLAFGAKYPEKQREFPIVALGSVWRYCRGDRCVVSLRSFDFGRGLDLHCWAGRWVGRYRFAAVHN